jgi:hypothetical protein
MNPSYIQIRTARPDDYFELWRLAELDSAAFPEQPALLAESEGEIVAALSLGTGDAIADPFRRSAEAVELLRLRATQLPPRRERSRSGLLRRLRGRPVPAPVTH